MIPDVLTPERASMRKACINCLKDTLDKPEDRATLVKSTASGVVDLIAGLLNYPDRPTAFWELSCTADGVVIGRRLADGRPKQLQTRTDMRVLLRLVAFQLSMPPDAAAYLMSLVPAPEKRLAEWKKIWADVPGLS